MIGKTSVYLFSHAQPTFSTMKRISTIAAGPQGQAWALGEGDEVNVATLDARLLHGFCEDVAELGCVVACDLPGMPPSCGMWVLTSLSRMVPSEAAMPTQRLSVVDSIPRQTSRSMVSTFKH